jgi:hypothetical protein
MGALMKKLLFTLVLALICSGNAWPGGSFSFEETLESLLKSDAPIGKHLLATLDFADSGFATRLGNHFVHLGGLRVGPYDIEAKPKVSSGPFVFEVTVETDMQFLDQNGKELVFDDALKNAVRVKETVTGVRFKPAKKTDNK